ncbi:Transcriptional activator hap5 [Savitreella phatthalungensis]
MDSSHPYYQGMPSANPYGTSYLGYNPYQPFQQGQPQLDAGAGGHQGTTSGPSGLPQGGSVGSTDDQQIGAGGPPSKKRKAAGKKAGLGGKMDGSIPGPDGLSRLHDGSAGEYDPAALAGQAGSGIGGIPGGPGAAAAAAFNDPFANVTRGLDGIHKSLLSRYWQTTISEMEDHEHDFKTHSLPLARIKKVMKADEDVKMISAEAPVLFAKGCEIFITELTMRAWIHAEDNKRRTLQRSDIANAIGRSDMFDFLIDIVPREEFVANRAEDSGPSNHSVPSGAHMGTGHGSANMMSHAGGLPGMPGPGNDTSGGLKIPAMLPGYGADGHHIYSGFGGEHGPGTYEARYGQQSQQTQQQQQQQPPQQQGLHYYGHSGSVGQPQSNPSSTQPSQGGPGGYYVDPMYQSYTQHQQHQGQIQHQPHTSGPQHQSHGSIGGRQNGNGTTSAGSDGAAVVGQASALGRSGRGSR